MKLQALTLEDCLKVAEWRNDNMVGLRTPYPLTEGMQREFYENVICNRNSNHRYWGIQLFSGPDTKLIGMVGLTGIQWENRLAEISLITDPNRKGEGIGEEAVKLILEEAFGRMNLHSVIGECYAANPALGFWQKMVERWGDYSCWLPDKKFWDGKYHDSYYFRFSKTHLELIRKNQEEKE